MTTQEHDELNELIPAYALGALDPHEWAQVDQHLTTCKLCQVELAAYDAVVDSLAQALPEADPPQHLKDRLLTGIQPAARRAAPARSAWPWRLRGAKRPLTAAAFAALLLLFAAAWLWQAAGQRALPGTQLLMTATDAAPGATGIIHISADGEYGTLIVEGLPVLGDDQQYQLWLLVDGERTSGPVFSVYKDGYASKAIHVERRLADYEAFGVTIEPAGGSPGPTGPRVLAYNL